jgi:CRISPR-associated exonuclease Cas4
MPFPEDEWIPISAVEHHAYCPRQMALIHIEQIFDENIFTIKGRLAHRHVEEAATEWRGQMRVEYSLPLWSREWGLTGKADMVEISAETIFPVEHKVGKRRTRLCEDLQLCAQAVCLEEMLGRSVLRGAIFHTASHRRREVSLDSGLRERLRQELAAVRELFRLQTVPLPPNDSRCTHCSLLAACLPASVGQPTRDGGYWEALFVVDAQ